MLCLPVLLGSISYTTVEIAVALEPSPAPASVFVAEWEEGGVLEPPPILGDLVRVNDFVMTGSTVEPDLHSRVQQLKEMIYSQDMRMQAMSIDSCTCGLVLLSISLLAFFFSCATNAHRHPVVVQAEPAPIEKELAPKVVHV